jgi:hypothetical protein
MGQRRRDATCRKIRYDYDEVRGTHDTITMGLGGNMNQEVYMLLDAVFVIVRFGFVEVMMGGWDA